MSQIRNLALCLMAASACGGSDSVSLEQFSAELADALCAAQVRCGRFPDAQTCRASTVVDLSQILLGVEQGRANYSGAKASECLEFLAGDTMCSWSLVFSDGLQLSACEQVFTGSAATGGSCYDSRECATGGECERACAAGECCAGTCAAGSGSPAVGAVAIGADCSQAPCVSGAYCDDSNTCAAAVGEGEVCAGFGSQYCNGELFCDTAVDPGTCYALPGLGELCDPTRGAGLVGCNSTTLWCDPSDNRCRKLPGPGEACDPQGAGCLPYANCIGDVCVRSPAVSDECLAATFACIGDLQCIEGRCTLPAVPPVCGDAR